MLNKHNYHLTETESGTWSTVTTDEAPGEYEGNPDTGEQPSIVAPGDFVDAYIEKEEEGRATSEAVRAAIRAWARQEGLRK